jgi:hypothetical protein
MAARKVKNSAVQPVKGNIGNKSPNQRAVLKYAPTKRPRVLRALDPMTYKTLQRQAPPAGLVTLDKPAVTKNTFYQRGRPVTRAKAKVKRLFRRDPYNIWSVPGTAPPPFSSGATQATFAPEAENVTNNPNPMYQPMKGVSEVQTPAVVRQPQPVAGNRNHGNRLLPNRITQFGGKTLKRR